MLPTARVEPHAVGPALSQLVDLAGAHGSAALRRVIEMAEIALGSRPPPVRHPLQRPNAFHMPGLESAPWHDASSTALAPVARVLEEAYSGIRAEAMALFDRADEHYLPYAEAYPPAPATEAHAGWHVSALSGGDSGLMRQRLESCPRTMAALAEIAPYRMEGELMFSLLEPGTELVRHLSLIHIS